MSSNDVSQDSTLLLLRKYILNNRIQEPFVLREFHTNYWEPCSWPLNYWDEEIFKGEMLNLRCGKSIWTDKQPQWESDCKQMKMTWSEFLNWNQDQDEKSEWLYFDYKYMREILTDDQLKKFSWEKVGFDDRNGHDSTLWIGTKNAYTQCHFDTYGSNLITQVYGRKKWLLFPPSDSAHLKPTRIPYEESSVYSQINFNDPNALQGLAQFTQGLEIVLNPGDVLFVPPKWWHFVKSETFSISVNTWIPLQDDHQIRVQEIIARTLISTFIPFTCCPPGPAGPTGPSEGSYSKILNPNEMDLIETSPKELEQILQKITEIALKESQELSNGNEESSCDFELPTVSSSKRVKKDSDSESVMCIKIKEMRKMFTKLPIESLSPFTTTTTSNINQINNIPADPDRKEKEQEQDSTDIFPQLINAILHPDILKLISAQFLDNLKENSQFRK